MQPFIPKHFPCVFILHTYTGVIPSFLARNNIQPYTYAAVCLTHTAYKADWLVRALRLPRNHLKDGGATSAAATSLLLQSWGLYTIFTLPPTCWSPSRNRLQKVTEARKKLQYPPETLFLEEECIILIKIQCKGMRAPKCLFRVLFIYSDVEIPVNVVVVLGFQIPKINIFQIQILAENYSVIKYLRLIPPPITSFHFNKDIFKTILRIPEGKQIAFFSLFNCFLEVHHSWGDC